jgi:hypothetical protein
VILKKTRALLTRVWYFILYGLIHRPVGFYPQGEGSVYDLSELKEGYVYMSGGDRQSPPVYKRYSLFGGSEDKED